MPITTPDTADDRIPVAPRLRAGPGEPQTLRSALTDRGWTVASGQDVLLASGCRRLHLAATAEERTSGWQLRAAEHADHPPLWTIAFSSEENSTPSPRGTTSGVNCGRLDDGAPIRLTPDRPHAACGPLVGSEYTK